MAPTRGKRPSAPRCDVAPLLNACTDDRAYDRATTPRGDAESDREDPVLDLLRGARSQSHPFGIGIRPRRLVHRVGWCGSGDRRAHRRHQDGSARDSHRRGLRGALDVCVGDVVDRRTRHGCGRIRVRIDGAQGMAERIRIPGHRIEFHRIGWRAGRGSIGDGSGSAGDRLPRLGCDRRRDRAATFPQAGTACAFGNTANRHRLCEHARRCHVRHPELGDRIESRARRRLARDDPVPRDPAAHPRRLHEIPTSRRGHRRGIRGHHRSV